MENYTVEIRNYNNHYIMVEFSEYCNQKCIGCKRIITDNENMTACESESTDDCFEQGAYEK